MALPAGVNKTTGLAIALAEYRKAAETGPRGTGRSRES